MRRCVVLEDTGERLIPQVHAGSIGYAEHLTRYLAAAPLCIDKDVLNRERLGLRQSRAGYDVAIRRRCRHQRRGCDLRPGELLG